MLLAQVARRFEEACGEGCELARLGGDEFVAALPGSNRAATRQVEARLRHALDEPFCIDGCDLSISVSIGVAAFPEDGATYDKLLHAADQRMYEEKRRR